MTSDKIFPVTKSYALRGTLLPPAHLQSLSEAANVSDLITRLKATPYSDAVSKIQYPHSAYKIELAAREHVSSLHYNLMKVYPDVDLFFAYYMKYIVSDLKTVLKGKAIGRSYQEIQRYFDMHAEELVHRRDLIARAVAATNLDEMVSLFKGTEFSDEMEEAVRTYKSTQKFDVFDVYLDKALYTGILDAYTKKRYEKLRPIISVDVDSYNVLAVLRAKSWDVPQSQIRSLIVEPTFDISEGIYDASKGTFDVSEGALERMISAPSIPEAARFLAGTPYRNLIPQSSQGAIAFVSALEEAFKRLGYERANHPFLWDSFNEGVVLGLIRLKELEARNISAIAFGVEHSLGPKAIMQKLIYAK